MIQRESQVKVSYLSTLVYALYPLQTLHVTVNTYRKHVPHLPHLTRARQWAIPTLGQVRLTDRVESNVRFDA
jgi:hypothetical protein